MLSIVRCPSCGKATVGIGSRNRAREICAHCGRPLGAEKLSVSDPDTLEHLVRERLHRSPGLNRSRRFRT
ncbi:MAG: hypothetical protein R2718_08100 [Solirubrobacterales bacterium]|nr:hypothetical protein [Solirubrobacterales bacterium]